MKKEAKIKSSVPMIIGKIIPVVVLLISATMLLLLLVPDGQKVIELNNEEDVKQSLAYDCSTKALEYILNDDAIERIISICYICPNNDLLDYTSVKITYDNGNEEKTRYFETDYGPAIKFSEKKLIFHEIDEKQHRINSRFLIFSYFIPNWKNNDMREREYNEFAVEVILMNAKENSEWH